jgi:diguanylate cyclase (GGDEF)-like protein/PAS domain S-box-containing protein
MDHHEHGPSVSDQDRFFREVVDELPDLVCRFAPDGVLLYVNKAYAGYFGSTPEALIGTNFLDLVPADEREQALRALHATRELTPTSSTRTTEHRGGDRDGKRRWQQWVDKALFDEHGNVTDLLAVGRDTTERHSAEEQLRYHSQHDQLTGLLNRRCALQALDAAISDAVHDARQLGLVFIDLDEFKEVNDQFGHRAGDRLLAEVGRLLVDAVRESDVIGRIGGDEFVVICPKVHALDELTAITMRIGDRLASLARPCTASCGIALQEPGESADELLHRADQAMYAAKLARQPAA